MGAKNIVLRLDSGKNFPVRTGDKVLIKAKLDNVTLETDENIIQSSDRTIIFENELVWEETSKAMLTALRTKRACVKIEVFIQTKLLGYLVLDLRSCGVVEI